MLQIDMLRRLLFVVLLHATTRLTWATSYTDTKTYINFTANCVHERVVCDTLTNLTLLVLKESGLNATYVPPPGDCELHPESQECFDNITELVQEGSVHAALVTTARVIAALKVKKHKAVDFLGAVTPATHRTCAQRAGPAHSMLDLLQPHIARQYNVIPAPLHHYDTKDNSSSNDYGVIFANSKMASDLKDLDIIKKIKSEVISVSDSELAYLMKENASSPLLVCYWTPGPAMSSDLTQLGPPPCGQSQDVCAFDSRYTLKLIHTKEFNVNKKSFRTFTNFQMDKKSWQHFVATVERHGNNSLAAAEELSKTNTILHWLNKIIIPVFMMSADSHYNQAVKGIFNMIGNRYRFLNGAGPEILVVQTELLECRKQMASDFFTLEKIEAYSAATWPGCRRVFTELVADGGAHGVTLLGTTRQALPPAPAANTAAVLAAGDSRAHTPALAALLDLMNWRRLFVITDGSSAIDFTQLSDNIKFLADNVVHNFTDIALWASANSGRIIYVDVENVHWVRLVICEGYRNGLSAANGVVWILPGELGRDWRIPEKNSTEICSEEDLLDATEGHFSFVPAWHQSITNETWITEWQNNCRASASASARDDDIQNECREPGPHAPLLYDMLSQWCEALRARLDRYPSSLHNLQSEDMMKYMINHVKNMNYNGITGLFQWTATGDNIITRKIDVILQQQINTTMVTVGEWANDSLNINMTTIHWLTANNEIPNDGRAVCVLPWMEDCAYAYIALCALLFIISIIMMLCTAIWWRRRLERKALQYKQNLELLNSPPPLDQWELPRECVVINRRLGFGAFGTVYGGHAKTDGDWIPVAVKMLRAEAGNNEKLDFLSEAVAMKEFKHVNVVRLVGVVTRCSPVCTVMELMLHGDLRTFLLGRQCGGGAAVAPAALTRMALDVARALSYLAQLRYVHRDVAARNCLVDISYTVKLADFGMTRPVGESDYYRFSRRAKLPVRWMAPESLCLGLYTTESDIWSFGVLLYEIVTFGSQPYQGLTNAEVLEKVKKGGTLELPIDMKPQLKGLIKSCWLQDYRRRPSASAVAEFLASTPRLLTPCLREGGAVPLAALPAAEHALLPTDHDAESIQNALGWSADTSACTDTTYTYLSAEPERALLVRRAQPA